MDNSVEFFRDDLDERDVMVTIHCITYNHDRYIRNALEGFVSQKVNFRFEAIVHDDCSTDGTADIIREYAEKYPSIIKPIFEIENQYCKRDGSIERIMLDRTRGKYVAVCEGDDYWTDPFKLQKQVDFMESHPDYSMVFHNAMVHYVDGDYPDKPFASLEERDYQKLEIFNPWIIPTASVVIKRKCLFSEKYCKAKDSNSFLAGDILIFLSAFSEGKVRALNDIMSVYRRSSAGANMAIRRNKKKFIENCRFIPIYFGNEYLEFAKYNSTLGLMQLCAICIKEGKFLQAMNCFFSSLSYAPIYTLKFINSYICRHIK